MPPARSRACTSRSPNVSRNSRRPAASYGRFATCSAFPFPPAPDAPHLHLHGVVLDETAQAGDGARDLWVDERGVFTDGPIALLDVAAVLALRDALPRGRRSA